MLVPCSRPGAVGVFRRRVRYIILAADLFTTAHQRERVTGPVSRPSWHQLLAPLPADAVPQRGPVASPEVLAGPDGRAIAGWEQLTLNLSAGAIGLRTILVVLDAGGTPISANDGILSRLDPSGRPAAEWDGPPRSSIRKVSAGALRPTAASAAPAGTRRPWWSGRDEEPQWEWIRLQPSENDVAALRLLVAEMVRRGVAR